VSLDTKDNKIIVTSALPYANGEIHLGHIVSTYLPADIFTRYCRLKGYNVVHICATDDFGTPILIRSEQEGKTPSEYVNYWNQKDLEDFTDLGITFDLFGNTSSNENKKLTQDFFNKLKKNGHIEKKTVMQLYCENDKKFLPDRYVKGVCPYCNAQDQYSDGCEKCGQIFQPGEIKNAVCAICGKTPIQKQSEHLFFKVSKFSDKLKEWLTENKNLQDEVKNYVLKWIQDGLRDWDITRDISWGISVPETKDKVFYGWFDNHLCYISTALTYLSNNNINGKDFWNKSKIYHFIGKDIVYHHYLFLPAMRMGINEEYKLPDLIPTRGHLMLHGEKFSKSRGWYVGLREFLNNFQADYLRYYLATITPFKQTDVNFDWDDFYSRINNELVANIGNFMHRTLNFISTYHNGEVPTPEEYENIDQEFKEKLLNISKEVDNYLEINEFDKGLKSIIDFSANCNRYFQHREPWKGERGSKTCLFLCINAVKTISVLLDPYLSFSLEKIWKQLNIKNSGSWNSASIIDIKPGHKIGKPEILFKKLEYSEIQRQKNKLNKTDDKMQSSEKKLLIGKSLKPDKMNEITIDDFTKLDFRIGKIINANYLKGSDKLLKIQISIGDEIRQSISGIAEHYTPEDLKNQLVAVIVNLKPRKMFGETSDVMLLAAIDKNKVSLLNPNKEVLEGSKIT